MIDAFLQLEFLQRALAASVLLGLLTAAVGVFVVVRRLAFLGDGLAHATFGGVALGLALGTQPLAVAIPFTLLVSLGIAWTRQHRQVTADTAVGVFFAGSVALGILLIHKSQAYSTDIEALIFGNVLAVTPEDLWVAAVTTALGVLVLWRTWRGLAYASFDPELAALSGVPVRTQEYLLFGLVAVVVVVGIRLVGVILVSAFLVIPAASARLVARTFVGATALSCLIGLIAAVAGLVLSYALDTPSGATIILFQVAVFALAVGFSRAART